ncbi:unnamed protein product [Moneuplotes crassus]|uniref:DNA repair metallo-beta-lactamase domain-containing protein n=1 Tax=Euplotes crassus TaxID=5936 RepID=A0AAD1UEU4_EUPCR|nr:unnamed protein product [Moneuplotes crassus]
MGKIPNTNILVDKFRVGRYRKHTFVYFLSHFHSDHYCELSEHWNFGIIYMTHETRQLCVNKFPNLADCTVALELDVPCMIFLDKDNTEAIQVTLIDANHCPGSCMMLFEGKMGTILHTGDFRFSPKFFENEKLFPPMNYNEEEKGIACDIDHLICDGTFSEDDKIFESQEVAYNHILGIVKKHQDYRIYLFAYQLGKEEIFISLAKHFKTKIVLTPERYKTIELIGMDTQYFTTDETEGWIFVRHFIQRRKMDIEEYSIMGPTIFIVLTGKAEFVGATKKYIYNGKYSSHCDSKEMERFIKAICPRTLEFHSHPDTDKSRKFRGYLQRTYCRGNPSSCKQLESKLVDLHAKVIEKEFGDISTDFTKIARPPAMRKRKRHRASGAKLIHKKPIMTLTDDEEDENTADSNKNIPKVEIQKDDSEEDIDDLFNSDEDNLFKKPTEDVSKPNKRQKLC